MPLRHVLRPLVGTCALLLLFTLMQGSRAESCNAGSYLKDGVCEMCSQCAGDQIVTSECNATHDTMCGTCSAGMYRVDSTSCAHCNQCAGDQIVTAECSATSDTGCGTCTSGSYKFNSTTCASCSQCAGDQIITAECTASSDTMCGTCSSGSYKLNSTTCAQCSTCSGGLVVAAACNATHDTVCGACGSGSYMLNSACEQCTQCSGDQIVTAECTASSDTSCGTCSSGSYKFNSTTCAQCTQCSGDQIVSAECTASSDTSCGTCSSGSFKFNSTTCAQCTQCSGDQIVSAECTASSDTSCGTCSSGSFKLNSTTCAQCSACSGDQVVATACNTTHDAVCGVCDQGTYKLNSTTCSQCSTCSGQYVVASACNSTHDTVCRLGHFATGRVDLKVLGQSGKFDLIPLDADGNQLAADKIRVEMDSLYELNAAGSQIGNGGPRAGKHSVQSFAPESFTITGPTNTTYQGLTCQRIRFALRMVDDAAELVMDTYLFTESGTIAFGSGATEESFDVRGGSLKFNVEINTWPWCTGSSGNPCNGETGSDLELTIGVAGSSGATTPHQDANGNEVYDLGEGAAMTMSKVFKVGGVFEAAGSGDVTFASNSLKLRFPKPSGSTNTLMYDPIMSVGTVTCSANCANCSSNGTCDVCDGGYYKFNSTTCATCSQCSGDQVVTAECTASADTTCDTCSSGSYRLNSTTCAQCSSCAGQYVVETACTASQDTVCRLGKFVSGNVDLQVLGQSGKFDLIPMGDDGKQVTSDKIRVEMDSLYELNAAGSQIGNGGLRAGKHSIQSFAPESFTITGPTNTTYQGLACKRIRFALRMVDNTSELVMDTYLFTESGNVTFGSGATEESFAVRGGSLKFNVEINDWPWCNASSGNPCNGETGSDLELTIGVTGPSSTTTARQDDNGNEVYDLGEGAAMTMSKLFKVGGAFEAAGSGDISFASNSLKLRFPKPSGSTNTLMYDPIMSVNAVYDGSNGAGALFTARAVLTVVLAVLVSTFAVFGWV